MKRYICQVCGYSELDEPPWENDGKIPSHNICECCGVEFGYEDATSEGMFRYRKQWIESGGKWFDETKKPDNWNMEKQLMNIGVRI